MPVCESIPSWPLWFCPKQRALLLSNTTHVWNVTEM
jgi:hypothetical protein